MIVTQFYKKNGKFIGFKFSGHAESDDFGKDIVCAGVSSAVELTANAITDSFKIKAEVKVLKNTVILNLSNNQNENASLLIEALYLHIKNISDESGCVKIEIIQQ